ncbi:MAG: phosphoadenosine phosphosulfate reductase [Leptolyngbyaceae cyanobacterium bins.59]|nr:phosphoadenosine phosphosulfate reductase [Leptolyngbyaceae cyanobacterium bins.59]
MVPSAEFSVQLANLDLAQLNRRFEVSHPSRILTWCVHHLPTGFVQVSAFNVDDMVITDMIYAQARPQTPVPVLFLDTLHHFPETLELVYRAENLYHLNLKVYRTLNARSRETFASHYGASLWETDLQKFHFLTRLEPLERGLAELNTVAWITGRRRDQSSDRTDLPIFERDSQNRLRINPLATWTRKDVWAYVFEHDVIYNPLHDQGYPSIGDEPLTTPICEGDEERAGRCNSLDLYL